MKEKNIICIISLIDFKKENKESEKEEKTLIEVEIKYHIKGGYI